jgi:hypothetical protein
MLAAALAEERCAKSKECSSDANVPAAVPLPLLVSADLPDHGWKPDTKPGYRAEQQSSIASAGTTHVQRTEIQCTTPTPAGSDVLCKEILTISTRADYAVI